MIDALQLPEVLAGSRWIALTMTSSDGRYILPPQAIGIDPQKGQMYWCSVSYHPVTAPPVYFSSEARLTLPQLLSTCTLIDTPREKSPAK